jgi:hypothetical protein
MRGAADQTKRADDLHGMVRFSSRHFTVQHPPLYRTRISLIIGHLTPKNKVSPGISFMFHYALR